LRDVSLQQPLKAKLHEGLSVLRPLLLLDKARELPAILALGALLAGSIVSAAVLRWRMGRALRTHDVFWGLAIVFALAPMMYGTRKTWLLFVTERCQWLALLMLALWFAAIVSTNSGPWNLLIKASALLALPVHGWRLWSTERSMADLRHAHILTMEATAGLFPGKAVVPVIAEKNWLLQHLGAFAAVRYDGVFFWRKDHLHMKLADPPIPSVKGYLLRASYDRWWLPRHQHSGNRPDVEHLFFIGNDTVERGLWLRTWKKMIDRRYEVILDNGYCRVYDVKKGVGR
jgi:hypothetical protein